MKDRFVQAKNPMTGKWVKIDKQTATIIGRKKTPYKNIPIVSKNVKSNNRR